MNHAEAMAFIDLRLQPAVDPTLTTDELRQIVAAAASVDAGGLAPTADDWTATYSLVGCYSAIADGYEIKYAKAANRFSFTTDGQTFTRNQQLDHLEHQRDKYRSKVQSSPKTGMQV